MALFAAAGLFVGGVAMPSAKAADLGGDCCADLEERVAELEATTARKGNRKMSLTITGQVHRVVLWWDDGKSSNTYYGLDTTNSSTRFSFLGSAKVNPSVSMGFEIMIEIEAGGTSSKVSQLDEDGRVGSQISGTGGTSFNQSNVDAYFGDARRAAWWIEHKDIGRLTVGRYESAGVVQTIDLGGIGIAASSSFILLNGSFFIRGSSGQYYAMTWGNIGDPAAAQGRTELVRYTSPTWMGFIFDASIAEAGDYWGSMLRYAGEFSGFRIAAGIGYENSRDRATPATLDPTSAAFVGPAPDIQAWGGAASIMHVPSGLFVQGHWTRSDYNSPGHVANGYWGSTGGATKDDATHWLVQGGIAKNWFGIGNTALYGEYGKENDFGAESAGRDYTTANFTAVTGVTGTEMTIWGLGITQEVTAAASTLYLGYRHFDADIGCKTANCGSAATGGRVGGLPCGSPPPSEPCMRAFPAHGSSKPLTSSGLLLVGKGLLVADEVHELLIVRLARSAETAGLAIVKLKMLVVVQAFATARADAFLTPC